MDSNVVADFIAFEPAQLERDYRLFNGKTKQFIFISSASAYQTLYPIIELPGNSIIQSILGVFQKQNCL